MTADSLPLPLKYSVPFRRRRCHGAAMVVTLLAIAIGTLAAAAVATITLSHYSRAIADQNAAKALDLAESAALFQVQRIQTNLDRKPSVYDGTNLESATYAMWNRPFPVPSKLYNGTGNSLNDFLGISTSRNDHCIAWIEDPDNNMASLSLGTSKTYNIYGQAQVGGVWRRVRVQAGTGTLFDKWAVFGNSLVDIGGSFTATPTTGAYRALVASNTLINIKKPGSVGGQVIYGNGTPESSMPYLYGGPTYDLPSIDTLAERAYARGGYPANFRSGIDKFAGATTTSTNNDNYAMARVTTGKLTTGPMSATGNIGSKEGFPYYLPSKADGTPANYYLTRLDGSNATIYADVSNGPVNLWVNVGVIIDSQDNAEIIGTTFTDALQGNVQIIAYTTKDSKGIPIASLDAAKKFHIFYNNWRGSINIRGGGSADGIFAMFYAFNRKDDGTPNGTVYLTGSVVIDGTLAANIIDGTGNFEVHYPQYIGPTDGGGIYYGIRNRFQEALPVRGN